MTDPDGFMGAGDSAVFSRTDFKSNITKHCLLLVLVLFPSKGVAQDGEIHAAITPATASFVNGRWHTFYATIINNASAVARRCRIEIDGAGDFELHFVTTESKRDYNSPK